MTLEIGTRFPDFSLKDTQGEEYTLAKIKGNPAIFIFYPGDMTPGCTMQLCAIRDEWQDFRDAGVQVFGVNHGSATSHKKFNDLHKFPFPLLIDMDKAFSKQIGVVRTLFGFTLIKRTVIAIDAEGIIRYIRTGMPKNNEILKHIPRKREK